MVLGLAYLTKDKAGEKGEGMVFADKGEVVTAYQNRKVDLHARIKVRGINRDRRGPKARSASSPTLEGLHHRSAASSSTRSFRPSSASSTSPRARRSSPSSSSAATRRSAITAPSSSAGRPQEPGLPLRHRRRPLHLGLGHAHPRRSRRTRSPRPARRSSAIEQQAKNGVITEAERYNKIIDIWTHVTDKISDVMFDSMKADEHQTFQGRRGPLQLRLP